MLTLYRITRQFLLYIVFDIHTIVFRFKIQFFRLKRKQIRLISNFYYYESNKEFSLTRSLHQIACFTNKMRSYTIGFISH